MGRLTWAVLAGAMALSVAGGARTDPWESRDDKDAITDAVTVVAIGVTRDAALFVNCQLQPKPRLYVAFRSTKFLGGGSNSYRPLIYRIDDGAPQRAVFGHERNQALLSDQRQARQLAESLRGASKLLLRVETYDRQYVDAEIEMDGAAPAIDRALQACAPK